MANLAPKARIVEDTIGDDPCVMVEVHYPKAGVDRPHTYGCSCGKVSKKSHKLAERLVRAIDAGVAMTKGSVTKDKFGQTYVDSSAKFLGRRLNADLKRLGF